LTVSFQENGQVVAAVHTSGKTIWQVKLPAAAAVARVEGNPVIVEPSGLMLDLASGKAVQ
jgi:inosine/xanthosine triphosphate pyrophosphatase family protein